MAAQCPHLHARQVNKIAQRAELPQAEHWHQISVLLHCEPHKSCVQQRVVSGGSCPAVSITTDCCTYSSPSSQTLGLCSHLLYVFWHSTALDGSEQEGYELREGSTTESQFTLMLRVDDKLPSAAQPPSVYQLCLTAWHQND